MTLCDPYPVQKFRQFGIQVIQENFRVVQIICRLERIFAIISAFEHLQVFRKRIQFKCYIETMYLVSIFKP